MRTLIVNADDFGWSESVNRGIIDAARNGIVTSTSIIANAPGFDDAVARAKGMLELGVGIHLNIFRMHPLLPKAEVPTLVNKEGNFFGNAGNIALRTFFGFIKTEEVEKEWRAQIRKVKAAGIIPTHFDSEKHLHLLPPFFTIALRLAQEFGIRHIRVVREPFSLNVKSLILRMLSAWNAPRALRAGLRVVDGTIGVANAPHSRDALLRLLKQAKGASVELISHPGLLNASFWEMQKSVPNALTTQREEEQKVLADRGARALVAQRGFTLAHF